MRRFVGLAFIVLMSALIIPSPAHAQTSDVYHLSLRFRGAPTVAHGKSVTIVGNTREPRTVHITYDGMMWDVPTTATGFYRLTVTATHSGFFKARLGSATRKVFLTVPEPYRLAGTGYTTSDETTLSAGILTYIGKCPYLKASSVSISYGSMWTTVHADGKTSIKDFPGGRSYFTIDAPAECSFTLDIR